LARGVRSIIDIRPYDLAKLLNEPSTEPVDVIKEGELVRVKGQLYRQTTTLPRKKGKHTIS
jgi:predicted NAD/FAD-binding protein